MPISDADAILAQAKAELAVESRRAAVDAEKRRLLTHRTLLQRLAAALPFTVTVTRNRK